MTEQLKIARIGHRGDGIADTNAGPVYVPYALPGETVTVEPVGGHPDRRHLLSVDHASHERVPPICKHFGICGGCATQHWSLAEYLLWKRNLVVEALGHAGLIAPVDSIIDAHGKGRRRAVLHARRGNGDVLEVGFAAQRSHQIVGIDTCPILAPGLGGAVPAAWAIAEILKPANKPLDIHVTATDSGLDVDVRGSGPLSTKLTTAMARLAEQHRLARITRHGELALQREQPMLKVGRAAVPLPPGAFLQATAEGEATRRRLYETAIALIRERGYEAATLRDVATRAGVSPALLYRYFPNKRALVLALYDRLSEAFVQQASIPPGKWRERFAFALERSLRVLGPYRVTLRVLAPIMVSDADEGIWSAGQVQGLIHDIPSCAELVSRIMREAEAIIQGRLEGMISGNRRQAAE